MEKSEGSILMESRHHFSPNSDPLCHSRPVKNSNTKKSPQKYVLKKSFYRVAGIKSSTKVYPLFFLLKYAF